MNKTLLFASAIAMCMAFASCSQETDSIVEQERCEIRSSQDVGDLLAQLKAYDSQFAPRKMPMFSAVDKKKKLNWLDWLKIGLADVKGAISGFKESGWSGATMSAAVSSLEKYIEIYVSKNVEKEKKEMNLGLSIVSNNSTPTFNDSIGYYHNLSEEFIYDKYGNAAYDRSMKYMLMDANAFLRNKSYTCRKEKPISYRTFDTLSRTIQALKNIPDDSSVDFFDYCRSVKAIEQGDSSLVDFAAEYLYTCVCSNVGDMKEYTNNVLRQIDGSNSDSYVKGMLTASILVGYSSLMYSAQIECKEIEK